MSLQYSESIVLVSGCDSSTSKFGTGFVIHNASDATCVLTSAHVVKDVGEENLTVDGKPAKVIKTSTPEEFDVAVLEVKGLFNKPPLILSNTGAEGSPITILGFYKPVLSFTPVLRRICGKLSDQGMFTSKSDQDRAASWNLKLDGEHLLQRGYSGSPVIENISNHVLGVVRISENNGQQGMATSVTALKKIWPNAPFNLKEDTHQIPEPVMSRISNVQVFVFYADQDEKYRKQFEEMCLSPLEGRNIIKVWSKDKIRPGTNRKQAIEHNLNNASIVLLLITRSFMNAYYKNTNNFKSQIIQLRQKQETIKIIPILMRAANWEQEFSDLQFLPRNGKFVNDKAWGGQDLALYQIAKELEEEIN